MDIPTDLLYTKDHEWVRIEGGQATVGITAHAQEALGDITFVELPASGKVVSQGSQCANVESVKAASDVYAPLSGTVAAINTQLEDEPALVNQQPYTQGWFIKIQLKDPAEANNLMKPDQYRQLLERIDG